MKNIFLIVLFTFVTACSSHKNKSSIVSSKVFEAPFLWENANIYFLLTDRFYNADTSNDINYNRNLETGKLRGFEGGDIKGITKKIEEGYFNQLGINAIWFTPIVEQIHGAVDEGTGLSYGFHGYWTKDWTTLDPNYGTTEDLKVLVETAHKNGIRIILDGVINHTGPVTEKDQVWPTNWVRTEPQCNYQSYDSTITCTLVKNLPDIKTESEESVELPKHLVEKWKAEGRYEQELKELDAFFARTGYPRAPKYYIIKWLTDYVIELGIDGYRADTVKHTEESVWNVFKTECDYAFAQWKNNNPTKVLDNNPFYLVGEVYNYGISTGQNFNFGDRNVNYFENGFKSLINFDFKHNANDNYEAIFSKYSTILNGELKGLSTVNYVSSHDDGSPFDKERKRSKESATKLLLTPGASQVYYGDESARTLIIEGTVGDATLRSNMNWNDIKNNLETKDILEHWQKLGKFRANHPSVGAGVHKLISTQPYIFQRTYSNENYKDEVVVGLDLAVGSKEIKVGNVFAEGTTVLDAYSGKEGTVRNGLVKISTEFSIVLLENKNHKK
ncbi:alpha-amylase family glycosyl hydrolase [Lutibacter sp.]|uniref:alpha-amylase family glycosyl hydrolase n=1 Tax=Lutibacter sp. TaxID=1925666 RepID=UPI00273717CC|nr:alpha-amylase family glycosyl hydrolase [Lutibacter sp.]MDP3312451.1 alpha-amylase family glycosyl hydrolase [Lutibacter sp.]